MIVHSSWSTLVNKHGQTKMVFSDQAITLNWCAVKSFSLKHKQSTNANSQKEL